MKRKFFCLILFLIIVLTSCTRIISEPENESLGVKFVASNTSDGYGNTENNIQGKIIKTIPKVNEYLYFCDDLKDMINYSQQILNIQLENVNYIIKDGNVYSKLDVRVINCFKGSFKSGDRVTVVKYGGYITAYDYNLLNNIKSNKSKNELKNQFYEYRYDFSDEPQPKSGDVYIMALNPSSEIKNAYLPVTDNFTVYKLDRNGKYTRFLQTKQNASKIDKENSIESFTVSWFSEFFNNSGKSEIM